MATGPKNKPMCFEWETYHLIEPWAREHVLKLYIIINLFRHRDTE